MNKLIMFIILFLTFIALAIIVFMMYHRRAPKEPDGFILSKSSEDFPRAVCYSGTKSNLLELTPLTLGDTNIVLVREWIWKPTSTSQELKEVCITIENEFGKKSICYKPFRKGMYIYSPLIIGIIPYSGTVKSESYSINVPECFQNKKMDFLGGRETPPTAVELSGRLDDLQGWLSTGTRRELLEILKLYENEDIRIFVIRYTFFMPNPLPSSIAYLAVFDDKGNKLLYAEILLKGYKTYHSSNAILVVLPRGTYVIKVGSVSAKV